jgi:transcriptional regulator with XRE-family HTH domain
MEVKIFIEKIRLENGLSLSELARRSGIAKSHLHYIECGEIYPTLLVLCKIAKALNTPAAELFTYDD